MPQPPNILVCARPASLVDLLPTICALGGADAGDGDGIRLDTLAAGNGFREAVCSHLGTDARANYAILIGTGRTGLRGRPAIPLRGC